MIYPSQFERKIGFDKIKSILEAYCISPMGKEWLDKLKFSAHFLRITQWLSQTEEMKSLLLSGVSVPGTDFFDLRQVLEQAKIEGNYLSTENIHDLALVLDTMQRLKHTFDAHDYPVLFALFENWLVFSHIQNDIRSILDSNGQVLDTASDNLREIRHQLRQHYANNETHIQKYLQDAISQGWTATDSQVAIRNGRLVVPVYAQHKRRIKGFVHAESATGQTVFIEPQALFQINNEIVELEAEERREIQRILLAFTKLIRPEIPDLIQSFNTLGLVDFLMAKARLAIDIEAVKPDVQDKSIVDWQGAHHPLLYLSHKEQNKQVVPLDICLNTTKSILIISGPNAGGKSVALKTVGLLQYMIQCGLLVPMKPTSTTGIFKRFFIDIGDEQSIENDLSTYSSHLLNMKYFLQNATNRTLFLIDEMGGGTDPHMGGAIAESVLDKLSQKACYGLVTTHFSNLKLMAAPDNNIENGAMLFNTEALEPLYILQTGFPGSSFTIEIAKKIGFPHDVITSLQGKVNQKQLDFEAQLQQLDVERKALQQQKKSMDMSDQLLNETLEKYQNLYESLKADKQSIIREAKNEAKNMLMSSNKLIEKTIHDIKTTKADKIKTKQARQHIQEEITKLSDKKEDTSPKEIVHSIATKPLQPQKAKVKKEAPKVGDLVTIEGQTGSAVLESIKGKNAVVVMGNMRMRIAYNKLLKTSKKKIKKDSKTAVYTKLADDINEKVLRFQPKIDIRGQRLEEALENTKQFIDEAIMLRMHEVQILHGKGTGVLRAHIRQYLQGIPEVAHVLDEHVDRGGHGITIVRFDL